MRFHADNRPPSPPEFDSRFGEQSLGVGCWQKNENDMRCDEEIDGLKSWKVTQRVGQSLEEGPTRLAGEVLIE